MRRFVFTRPLRLLAFPVMAALAAGVACSADFPDADMNGNEPLPGDGGKQNTVRLDSGKADSGGPIAPRISPLCGSVGFCDRGKIPDDALACADYEEPVPPVPGRDGGRQVDDFDASVSGGDAQAPDAGFVPQPDAGPLPNRPEAGVTTPADAAPDAPRSDATYTPPPAVPENPSGPRGEPFACQVRSDSNGNPSHSCARAGVGDDGAPCSSTDDCRAGLACVGEVGAGECRRYCCAIDGSPCGDPPDGGQARLFCDARPLLEPGKSAPTLRVPVCVPAEGCQLTEEPCVGPDCRCDGDEVCTVVGADGTTDCRKPGTGRVGQDCPCAAGYLCSAQNQCVRLCKTTREPTDCAPGKCAAVVGVPPGWGVCVGLAPALH